MILMSLLGLGHSIVRISILKIKNRYDQLGECNGLHAASWRISKLVGFPNEIASHNKVSRTTEPESI